MALALQVTLRLLDQRLRIAGRPGFGGRLRLRFEFGFEFQRRELLPRVLGGEADDDVFQLAHIAREAVFAP